MKEYPQQSIEIDEVTLRFISEHAEEDIGQLSLSTAKQGAINRVLALSQIEGRKKIREKIPSFYTTKGLFYPPRLSIEQTSSEITARYKSSLCQGKRLIDLTGGFGADIFFLSEHFEESFYVERDPDLCRIAAHNFHVLNKPEIRIFCSDAQDFITREEAQADWIYIDPARRNKAGRKTAALADCEPNLKELFPLLLQRSEKILMKLSPMIDISAVCRELPGIAQAHVLALNNECKELLFVAEREASSELRIFTRNFKKNGDCQSFDFVQDQEKKAQYKEAKQVGSYLYEANTAIIKSGAFRLISESYNLEKLHKHTHLYTSDKLIKNFPGRSFEVKALHGSSKQDRKELNALSRANVCVRNYPLSADELQKKLKILPGGEHFLFACTLLDESKVIIECKPLSA